MLSVFVGWLFIFFGFGNLEIYISVAVYLYCFSVRIDLGGLFLWIGLIALKAAILTIN